MWSDLESTLSVGPKRQGERKLDELKVINPGGEYSFVSKDMSLLRNVDEVCEDIKRRENVVDVLFLSQGRVRYGVGEFTGSITTKN